MEAFEKGAKEMPSDLSGIVKAMVDQVHDEALDQLTSYITDEMRSNINAEIRNQAASVASSMLANALAGDDRQIRTLFGFNDWYMKHLYSGSKPTQWALIDALVARRPDLFVSERIAQRDAEIGLLTQEVCRLKERLAYMENHYVVRDPASEDSP
jgi:hypothetical protein